MDSGVLNEEAERAGKTMRQCRKVVSHKLLVIALVALITMCSVVAPTGGSVPDARAYAGAATAGSPTPSKAASKRRKTHPLAADAWHRLMHYGNHPPARGARAKALQQAAALPTIGPAWTPLGPQPIDTVPCASNGQYCDNFGLNTGRITAIAVNPTDTTGNDVWIGAADGGVWHSTNGGAQWLPVLDGVGTGSDAPSLSIGAIAINPQNPSEIFVGTGEANGSDSVLGMGIYHSVDAGYTFSPTGAPLLNTFGIGKIAVSNSAATPYVLAAVSDDLHNPPQGGIYLSTDHVNWTEVVANTYATDVVYDPTNTNVAYAGLRTVVARDGSGTITKSPVMRSTDGGRNWAPVDLGLPAGTSVIRTSLALSPDGTSIYAVLTDPSGDLVNGVIYYSNDGGMHWDTIDSVLLGPNMATDSDRHQWGYNSTIAVDPATPSEIFAGGVDLWQWSSGGIGSSFQDITNTYGSNPYNVHEDHHALAFVPGGDTFYDGNDGGIWKGVKSTSCSCWTFTNLNGGGLNITQFYSGSAGTTGGSDRVWGGAQDNGTSSTNGALTWTQRYGGDGGTVVVDYTNNANVYQEYISGDLQVSTDGGVNWSKGWTGINICDQAASNPCANTPNPDPVNFVMPFVMSPQHNTELLAGTDRVYQTFGGGSSSISWTPISPPLDPYPCNNSTCYQPISALAVAPSNDSTIYVGDDAGHLYMTSGGGVWTDISPQPLPPAAVTALAVDPSNEHTVYATYGGYSPGQHILKSMTGGANWSDITNSLPGLPLMSVAVNPLNPQQVMVGSDGGIYTTSDGGANWSHFGAGLPDVEISQIFTDYGGGTLYVATHGRGMWKVALTTGHVYASLGGYGPLGGFEWEDRNASDGSVVWQQSNGPGGPVVYANGILYSLGGSSLIAYDAATGVRLWLSPLGTGTYVANPAVANGVVYVGVNQTAYAVNASTGAIIWSHTIGANLGGAGAPAVDTNGVYYGAADGKEYAFSVSTGAQLWSKSINSNKGPAPSPPTAANGLVYVASNDGSTNRVLYALNASTGRVSYSRSLGADSVALTPLVGNGLLYFKTSVGWLYAMKPDLSAIVWSLQSVFGGPALDGNKLFIIANANVYGGYLYALDASTGNTLWGTVGNGRVGNGSSDSPSVAGGVVTTLGQCGVVTFAEATGHMMWQWLIPPGNGCSDSPFDPVAVG